MSRTTMPRWGDQGVTEVPEFTLTTGQTRALAAMLGVVDPDDTEDLKAELESIGRRYLRWSAQDEKGPRRAERNAALGKILEASRRLEVLLEMLDHASEADLMDWLALYRSRTQEFDAEGNISDCRETEEFGFRQIQALRDRLSHFNESAGRRLKRRLGQRGPDPKKTLPAIIGFLAGLYERRAGQPVTHTPYKGTGDYSGAPQSAAGRFMAVFLKIVDPGLPATSIATGLDRHVRRRRATGGEAE